MGKPMLTIRADATPNMGTGHVMRCLALAQAAKNAGIEVRLVGRVLVPWVLRRLEAENVAFETLPGDVPDTEEPDALLAQIGPANGWLVLDGYHFGPDCHKAAISAGWKLLVIDDYAHLAEYHCDLLLNQNIGSSSFHYTGQSGQKLLGLDYALLRQEFKQYRQLSEKRTFSCGIRRVLLTLGGGDQAGFLNDLIKQLKFWIKPEMELAFVLGDTDRDVANTILAESGCRFKLLEQIDNMPEMMLWADFVITAGGSTCWELCCLGTPFAVFSLAENQEQLTEYLYEQGIALHLNNIQDWVLSEDMAFSLQRCSEAAMKMVDGNGATRVVEHMLSLSRFSLREADASDENFLLYIVNLPEIRKFASSLRNVEVEEHNKWFKERLASPASYIYIVLSLTGERIGYIRFEAKNGEAVLSVALLPSAQEHGFGTQVIIQGCSRLRRAISVPTIKAYVRADNKRAIHSFEKAGFKMSVATDTADDSILVEMVLE